MLDLKSAQCNKMDYLPDQHLECQDLLDIYNNDYEELLGSKLNVEEILQYIMQGDIEENDVFYDMNATTDQHSILSSANNSLDRVLPRIETLIKRRDGVSSANEHKSEFLSPAIKSSDISTQNSCTSTIDEIPDIDYFPPTPLSPFYPDDILNELEDFGYISCSDLLQSKISSVSCNTPNAHLVKDGDFTNSSQSFVIDPSQLPSHHRTVDNFPETPESMCLSCTSSTTELPHGIFPYSGVSPPVTPCSAAPGIVPSSNPGIASIYTDGFQMYTNHTTQYMTQGVSSLTQPNSHYQPFTSHASNNFADWKLNTSVIPNFFSRDNSTCSYNHLHHSSPDMAVSPNDSVNTVKAFEPNQNCEASSVKTGSSVTAQPVKRKRGRPRIHSLNIDKSRTRESSRRRSEFKKTSPAQRKRPEGNNSAHLWEFLRTLLESPEYNPSWIRWHDQDKGVFSLVAGKTEDVARQWGVLKNNPTMTYDKMSRSLRWCRDYGLMEEVPKDAGYPKKRCFKFTKSAQNFQRLQDLVTARKMEALLLKSKIKGWRQ